MMLSKVESSAAIEPLEVNTMKSKIGSLLAVTALSVFLLPAAPTQAGTKFGLYIGDYHPSDRHHSYRGRYSKKDHYYGKKDYYHGKKDYHREHGPKHYKRGHRSRGAKVIIISPRSHYRSDYGHGYRDYRDHGSYRGYRKHYRY
ncbi:MAG: hypothetical protein U5S82_09000 [Gammaproteobacteria bacterium]|nr:hypothetical protein [Gammaproteobacteria bacterium]